MTKDEALKLALSTLDEVRSETFRLLRNGQRLYAEEKVWSTMAIIKEALAQPEQELVVHLNVAYKLAQKELTRLAEENFGRMPNDKWANGVLDLRDYLEAQQTEDTK